MKSINLLLTISAIMVNAGINFAQSDSDILKYFENKQTPTVYISRKAIKDNSVLQSRLIRLDRSTRADLVNYVTKVKTGYIRTLKPSGIYNTRSQPETSGTAGTRYVADTASTRKPQPERVVNRGVREKLSTRVQPADEIQTRRTSESPTGKPEPKTGIHYDLSGNQSILYEHNKKVRTQEIAKCNKEPDSASFVSFDLRNNLALSFISDSCIQDVDSGNMYIETGIEVCKLEFPESPLSYSGPSTNFETLDEELKEELGRMDISNVNEFYFFDTFIPPSSGKSHGEKVNDIILNTLDRFNASQLAPKIKCVSLDFFEERSKALEIIDDYLDTKYNNSDINNQIWFRKQYYRIISKGGCTGVCMPSDFLNILLDYHLMKNPQPEIISMSFFMRTMFPVMCFSIKPDMKTNVLGAVLDNTGLIENIDTDMHGTTYEPIFTLKSNILPTGTLLIGAKSETDEIRCLHSANGVNVSSIGHGIWSGSFTGAPTNYGTSWATPEIATKLFIAKAYWKSAGMKINALDAKIRLMLSCDLDTSFVGKFGSAGIPDMNKLLRKKVDGFIEENDSIVDIRIGGNPKIIFHLTNGDEILYNLKTGNKNNYIRGIYFEDNAFFIFQESVMKWERVDELDVNNPKSVDFRNFNFTSVKSGRKINITGIGNLKNLNINQIVRL